jgi:myb proto-oncogene protein
MMSELANRWTDIALKMFELGASKILRTAKQVRERWANYIDPDIRRDQWTDHDD